MIAQNNAKISLTSFGLRIPSEVAIELLYFAH